MFRVVPAPCPQDSSVKASRGMDGTSVKAMYVHSMHVSSACCGHSESTAGGKHTHTHTSTWLKVCSFSCLCILAHSLPTVSPTHHPEWLLEMPVDLEDVYNRQHAGGQGASRVGSQVLPLGGYITDLLARLKFY